MRKKTLVVIYKKDDWESATPLEKSPETKASFEEFYEFSRKMNIEVYRSSIEWFDEENFCFKKGWGFTNGKWKRFESAIIPDAIFDKVAGKHDYRLFDIKQRISKKIPIGNPPLFRALFDNKLSQYLAFSEFMPLSYIAENQAQFRDVLQKIRTEKVVTKEIYGSGGKEVAIETKVDAQKNSQPFPILMQEFIETSGIPDFSPKGSVADLRLVYTDNELIYALSRIAKEGSLFTNFHQGARAIIVPQENIPASCLAMSAQIRKKLSLFPQTNYSLDFMFTTDGEPLFIEMNTTPGFDLLRLVGTKETKELYYRRLLQSLLRQTL